MSDRDFYTNADDRAVRLMGLIADRTITPLDAGLDLLRMYYDFGLECNGGYPALIDAESVPGFVIVAEANENGMPSLDVYRVDRLATVAAEFLDNCREEVTNLTTGYGLFRNHQRRVIAQHRNSVVEPPADGDDETDDDVDELINGFMDGLNQEETDG